MKIRFLLWSMVRAINAKNLIVNGGNHWTKPVCSYMHLKKGAFQSVGDLLLM